MGSSSANELAAEADVVLAIGTRLQDFTPAPDAFCSDARFIGLNTARFDRHQAPEPRCRGRCARQPGGTGAALGDGGALRLAGAQPGALQGMERLYREA
jgi:3D-(3,5/4)-trihydroxycyclohexane-1,2-dione acylhydrolase (decyclizing)